ILLHASNFRKLKRVDDIVRIFAEVRKKIPSKLLLVGDGPDRSAAEDLCRELNLSEDVRFVGKQEQMEEIIAVADLFLLPSEYESFGLAALEAMAAGVPVISTDVGGLPEINVDGITGFLSHVGDIENMSRNAITILESDATLQKFKASAAVHAKLFDIHRIVPQYEALYNRFCKCL
ncbi:MAG TPA: glycosyltransferase, partial [Puia sp.]|nr:glycosyltransferase [Puia sp.]